MQVVRSLYGLASVWPTANRTTFPQFSIPDICSFDTKRGYFLVNFIVLRTEISQLLFHAKWKRKNVCRLAYSFFNLFTKVDLNRFLIEDKNLFTDWKLMLMDNIHFSIWMTIIRHEKCIGEKKKINDKTRRRIARKMNVCWLSVGNNVHFLLCID